MLHYVKILACLMTVGLDQDYRLYERPGAEDPPNILSGCGIRLSQLLKEAEFTVEHKIKLSYTVARAFWQITIQSAIILAEENKKLRVEV